MSDVLRIGLIAEGPTDRVIIEAALKAILGAQPFVLTLLQPDATLPRMGAGWGGVWRWCAQFARDEATVLSNYPPLLGFDLVVLHIDADVASFAYTDIARDLVVAPTWRPLPHDTPCPPCAGAADHMRATLLSWLELEQLEPHCVLCVPSKCSDAWLGLAVYPDNVLVTDNIECAMDMEHRLSSRLRAKQRIRKTRAQYIVHAPTITSSWDRVCEVLSQAKRFHDEMRGAYTSSTQLREA